MAKLYIVGTPIGNLEDITLRALRTLQEVNIIACEDTRVTSKLLQRYEISNKKLLTYNNFTEKHSAQGIINLISNGEDVALVSDAGMPVVSDPGFEVIAEARKNNIDIEIIPGVNAAITAFVASNFTNDFTFHGFIKDKTQQRINQLKELNIGTHIYYVSPHKLISTLEDINSVFNGQEKICLAKELTKLHENLFYGSASEILQHFANLDSIKGEFTMVLNLPKIKREKVNKYKKD
ncbi:16S rRNA (cytidine(1402)-2'-O)-methyltransferase [Mycoplasma sp. 2704]|uniref:16S rRNA (cytidine(1402)-2'-O)-methyltransferase n=1 Tax=unclassified Mycoplasma TaxID=2683645 RepID=UPI002B1DAE31|nr:MULTISPECIES: 16S rRNA (cytidine(1402)-2'-O)-methyltransferase [unclassified Mycoplasma]MEA4134610.1 16S rRNA (cytidine(1402)-2'-O)-methyltransferase [Mycoplasma sp. 2704]MEA4162868.1 16S rRNA (cytidine(1402)-2'-O)-methyltransferase [Mycoplasma sp. 4404]